MAPPPGGVYYPASGGLPPDDLSEKRRLMADIFHATARVYLHSVISGEHPGCPKIRDGVWETIDCLWRIHGRRGRGRQQRRRHKRGASVLCSAVFGIRLCGCLADDPKDREFLLQRLDAEEQAEGVGNCTSACLVMQEVWRRRAPCTNGGGGPNGCCGDELTALLSSAPSLPSLSWRPPPRQ
ncbi:fungal-specific transcription factor domain-containing protein [Russula aff. rugulosa BPL654]|nr:fungal-specific transcription factor domain-containing protein [Russula aff. rugulosa BPL654]